MPSEDTQFKEGNPGGPGRPKGSISLTERMRHRLAQLDPSTKREIIDRLIDNILQDALESESTLSGKMRELIWNYIDGKPQQYTDITSGGEKLPTPLLANLNATNDGNPQDTPTEEAH